MSGLEGVRLASRDRAAFGFRVVGALGGLLYVAWMLATSSWNSAWAVAVFCLVTVGGTVAYHLLTSVVSCPACFRRMVNLRILSADANGKSFTCRHCGTNAYMTEGFYWQRDISG